MRRKPEVNVLIDDQHTQTSLSNFRLRPNYLKIRMKGPQRNVRNDIEKIETALKHPVSPLVLDLYNIALTVFMADIQTFKKETIGVRNFKILISVSDVNKWNIVKEHLEATLNTLTGDNFVFHFVRGQSEYQRTQKRLAQDRQQVVSLLSGGLDSLAGAKYLFDKGFRPIFVSHYASTIVAGVQRTLMNSLRNMHGSISHYQIYAKGIMGTELGTQKEYSQPSRSFLFLSIATIFAIELGIKKIFMFENGVIALNVPLTPSRIYLNTRTAHPVFIKMFNELLDLLFQMDLKVENPFYDLTKGEVVQLLNKPKYKELVKYSSSCFRISRLRWMGVKIGQVKHCGYCYPCVLRRFAIDHAGLWNFDGKYHEDIFGDFSAIPDEGRTLLLELLDFGRTLESCQTYEDVLQKYWAFYIGEQTDPIPFIDTYRRHIQQMKSCLSRRASSSLKARIRQYI